MWFLAEKHHRKLADIVRTPGATVSKVWKDTCRLSNRFAGDTQKLHEVLLWSSTDDLKSVSYMHAGRNY